MSEADVTRSREIVPQTGSSAVRTYLLQTQALTPREIVPEHLDASTPIVHKDYVGGRVTRGDALRAVLKTLLDADGKGQIDLSKVETILVHRVSWGEIGGERAHKVMAHLWVLKNCAVCGADTFKAGGLYQDGVDGPWYCGDHWNSHSKTAKPTK